MPLPSEILANISNQIEQANISIKSIQDIITDLRASGIDASAQEAALNAAKSELRKLQLFYSRQITK